MRRTTAALALALALLLTVDTTTSATHQRWDLVVVPVAVLGAVVAAVRVWAVGCFCGRVTAALLGAIVLVTQVLASEVGLPGRASAGWDPAAVATALVAVASVSVGTLGALARPRPGGVEHPYAL